MSEPERSQTIYITDGQSYLVGIPGLSGYLGFTAFAEGASFLLEFDWDNGSVAILYSQNGAVQGYIPFENINFEALSQEILEYNGQLVEFEQSGDGGPKIVNRILLPI